MADKIEITQLNGKDLMAQVYDKDNRKAGYERALGDKMTFSAYLEKLSPSQPNDKLDAFERLMHYCGIVTKNDAEHGIYAGTGDLFFQSNMPESRILFPEYINRTIRSAMIARGDFLSYMVSDWEYSVTGLFRAFYLDDTEANRKMAKKGAGSKPKIFKLSWSEKQVIAEQFALELQMTYDFVRGAGLPIIATALQRVALQKALDELALAIYVLINGDGGTKESGVAASTNLSAYGVVGPTSTANITYKSYLKWLATFYPYQATTLVASMTDIVELICMAKPSTDPALLYTLLEKNLTGGIPEIVANPFGKMSYIPSPDADVLTDNTLLTLDKNFALMGHRDVGMDLVETDRVISAQFEKIVISNKSAFSKIFTTAAKQLKTNT